MNLLPTLLVALRALGKNKMRACLTVLGIVIGVGAVTALVSVGQSASNKVQASLQEELGVNVVLVQGATTKKQSAQAGRGGVPLTCTLEDAEVIGSQARNVLLAVCPIVGTMESISYGTNSYGPEDSRDLQILGVNADYLVVRNWRTRLGGFFTDEQFKSSAKVCVLGKTLVSKLFQSTNPIGKEIRIRNIPFEVVGVLEAKGANILGKDQDAVVLMPYTTMRSRLKAAYGDKVEIIFCKVRSSDRMEEGKKVITQILNERHNIRAGDAADFSVQTTEELSALVGKITTIMTILLASIAGVALLVGGVGIMNIMLVSVTERTREIGIRMAVGAHQSDILRQFLIESVMLSTLGGLVGLFLGIASSIGIVTAINWMTPGSQWPIIISVRAAIIAILFSISIGVFFGYYPARRASQLDPIDALRYE